MNIIVTGINHKTAPIDVREQFFLTHVQQDLVLSELKSMPHVCEAIVLSTCNRTEIYLHLLSGVKTGDFVFDLLARVKGIASVRKYMKYFYTYSSEEAVEHLLKVTAGLDSLVLGENQILAQVKGAIARAKENAMLEKRFNILSNLALRTGKKARTETAINSGGSSVSWASVVMAERLLGGLSGRSVLIIGAGKMGELALNQICEKNGDGKVYIMNRTEKNAQDLAKRFPVQPVSFYEIRDVLGAVDLCICSSGAPHYILEPATIEKVMKLRGGRPLVFVDISMPRNIDPEIAEIENVTLIMLDDLDKFVDENLQKRQNAIREVEGIVQRKAREFFQKVEKLTLLPVLDRNETLL